MTTISVDYDGTFTKCPLLFYAFIQQAQHDGCTVICVSARIDQPESRKAIEWMMPFGVQVYLTNHNPKKEWCERRGIHVDIWIEDNPRAIFESDNPDKQIPDSQPIVAEIQRECHVV